MFIVYSCLSLLLCVFGAVIMSLEILSSSLMAPYFGGSIYVWGSIISAFMLHMSLGYVLGGYLAKKNGSLSALAWLLILASTCLIFIPFIHRPLCELISDRIADIRLGSLMAMFILSSPVVIMSMISPYVIGVFSMQNRQHSGINAGLVLLTSTVGSFLGTNITAFYLISIFPVSKIITSLGIIGLGISVVIFSFRIDRRLLITLGKDESTQKL